MFAASSLQLRVSVFSNRNARHCCRYSSPMPSGGLLNLPQTKMINEAALPFDVWCGPGLYDEFRDYTTSDNGRFSMKARRRIVLGLFALVVFAACASTKVAEQTPIVNESIPRPNRIWVYDFTATPADVPADSSIRGQVSAPSTPQTAEQVKTGRELGALIAKELVADIQAMGLPAAQATARTSPQVGDGVIRGYLVSVEGGSAVKRFTIGLGSGTSELDTLVEGYQVTPQGLRRLGSGTIGSSGGKTPGIAVPAVVAIATGNPIGLIVVGGMKIYGEASGRNKLLGRAKATADEIAAQLKVRFRERGWIS